MSLKPFITQALLVALLVCLVSCQSSRATHRRVIEAGDGSVVEFILHPKNPADQKTWDHSHERRVYFTASEPDGRALNRAIGCVFFPDNHLTRRKPIVDSTRLKFRVEKKREHGWLLSGGSLYSALKCKCPGRYLVTFHVDCYDPNFRAIYTSSTQPVHVHVSQGLLSRKHTEARPPVHLEVATE